MTPSSTEHCGAQAADRGIVLDDLGGRHHDVTAKDSRVERDRLFEVRDRKSDM
jgi:hypothetical protein